MNLMIFGAGYSGKAIAREFAGAGFAVTGTTRSPEKAAALKQAGIAPLLYDGQTLTPDLEQALAAATHLVQSVSPGPEGDALPGLLGDDLRRLAPRLTWIAYLSTVGVYGDHGGGWVTEETECRPEAARGAERLVAERDWLALGARHGLPVGVLRLSGIYGPGRNTFVNLAQGTARRLIKPGQVFNRIRVEDIGRATLHLASAGLGGIYNVTDDEPAPPQDVVTEAARLMGVAPPPEQDFATAELSPMARSFYGKNQRVSNAKLKATGFSFAFPEYRASLADLWRNERWKG
ncbi:SDR family oxidoreductase [Gellertiella hungarica]|uniref:Nucleoside-diphosphate-sugar epimerase n=1 Tax=Gellertiella hungarica TaxID=1572859 RepID=A0A7W6J2U7_9HYPH|nr:SDR family oxidoreductase [Gellertiella hungarica]MBB4063733.1 nucleoside-diphosphate-sugar epimerase [Gellertiella hungarica]